MRKFGITGPRSVKKANTYCEECERFPTKINRAADSNDRFGNGS